jgi:hypothetical protein
LDEEKEGRRGKKGAYQAKGATKGGRTGKRDEEEGWIKKRKQIPKRGRNRE